MSDTPNADALIQSLANEEKTRALNEVIADIDAILECPQIITGDMACEMAVAVQNMTFPVFTRLREIIGQPLIHALRDGEIGIARCEVDRHGNFQPGAGPVHVILPVKDDRLTIDLAAFRPDEPNRWALRKGEGWVLGLEDLRDAQSAYGTRPGAVYCDFLGTPLPLAENPLEWLRGDRKGSCLLEWNARTVEQLRDCHALDIASPKFAHAVRLQMSKPPKLPPIKVRNPDAPAGKPRPHVIQGGRHAA